MMAVGPKDLMSDEGVQQDALDALEAYVDRGLRRYEPVPGQAVAVSYEGLDIPPLTKGTIQAIVRLYTKAGWTNVGVNTTHHIVTVTCPRYRSA